MSVESQSRPAEPSFIGISPDIDQSELVHLFIPGYFRGLDDDRMQVVGNHLAQVAGDYFNQHLSRRGVVAFAGFEGSEQPEAKHEVAGPSAETQAGVGLFAMSASLLRHGVPEDSIRAETRSIDPVTGYLRSRDLLEHYSQVGIITLPRRFSGLDSRIAPKVLKNYTAALVVEDLPSDVDVVSKGEVRAARYVLRKLGSEPYDMERAERHARHAQKYL